MSRVRPQRLCLKHLAASPHPTLEDGIFSIWHDPLVQTAQAMTHYVDLDGVIVVARSLEAFNVCSCGETRVITKAYVEDQQSYLSKSAIFSNNYDSAHLRLAKYMPGFKFLDLPGGSSLKVVGVLNPRASVEDVERWTENPQLVKDFYFLNILNKSILTLPPDCRTRANNLVLTTELTKTLPSYYRLYDEDVTALSRAMRRSISSLPHDTPYKFYFLYHKYGQQTILTGPLTLQSTNLNSVVAREDKIDSANIHLAVNFSHFDERRALLWDIEKVGGAMQGRKLTKFPFMGLTEIGNASSQFPQMRGLVQCWADPGDVHLTHAQAYTPFIKPFGEYRPFQLHPFLISYLLGKDYIRSKKSYREVERGTENDHDYSSLKEATITQLYNNRARFEVAVTSRDLQTLLAVDLDKYARCIKSASLLVELPKADLAGYCLQLLDELHAPLEASHRGELDDDPTAIATILLCETLLSIMPGMCTLNAPYQLLKSYSLVPLQTGVISQERHLVLRQCASLSATGLLYVPRPLVDRVFLPSSATGLLSRGARKEVFELMAFLHTLKINSRKDMVQKAASLLVSQFIEELISTSMIAKKSVLTNPRELNAAGCSVHSVVNAEVYAKLAFDAVNLTRHSRLFGFLKVAKNLTDLMTTTATTTISLYPALAKELVKRLKFVPRVVTHARTHSMAATSFHVLAGRSFESLRIEVRMRPILEAECKPLLMAVEANLLRYLNVGPRRAKEVTRFSPEVGTVVSLVLRSFPHATEKTTLGVIGVTLVERSKLTGTLAPSVSTRNLQRACSMSRVATLARIQELLEEANH